MLGCLACLLSGLGTTLNPHKWAGSGRSARRALGARACPRSPWGGTPAGRGEAGARCPGHNNGARKGRWLPRHRRYRPVAAAATTRGEALQADGCRGHGTAGRRMLRRKPPWAAAARREGRPWGGHGLGSVGRRLPRRRGEMSRQWRPTAMRQPWCGRRPGRHGLAGCRGIGGGKRRKRGGWRLTREWGGKN